VKELACVKLDLKKRTKFIGLYIEIKRKDTNNFEERFIDDDEYIMDIISGLEIEK
jgi:hypothetical protein